MVVTFGSFVYPIKNKFTIGGYYHEPLNNEGGGVVAPFEDPVTGDVTPLPNFYLPAETNPTRIVGGPITRQECLDRRRTMNSPFSCLEFRVDPFVSVLDVRQRTYGVAGAWQGWQLAWGTDRLGGEARSREFRLGYHWSGI